jgi:hypothetical protein
MSNAKTGGLSAIKAHPMSDYDLRQLLGNNITIRTNRQIENETDIDNLFDNEGRLILLYTPDDPKFGHWVCLIRNADSIYYFDPYGDKPDLPGDLNGRPPVLTNLLKEKGLPVFYNTHPYQKLKEDIATCGRWCAVRLHYKNKTEDQFFRIVKKFKGCPDDFVAAFVYNFIKE